MQYGGWTIKIGFGRQRRPEVRRRVTDAIPKEARRRNANNGERLASMKIVDPKIDGSEANSVCHAR
jgi:hypothetical protein